MQIEKQEGFVLGHTSLSTNRVILTVFTLETGKRQGVWQIRSKQSRAALTPLSTISYVSTNKEHQELGKIRDVSLEHHHYDFATSYIGLCLLEHWAFLINASQPDQQPDERVFRLLNHCLGALGSQAEPGRVGVANLYFESWLQHLCGVLPRVRAGEHEQMEPGGDTDYRLFQSLQTPIMERIFRSKVDTLADAPPPPGILVGPMATLGKLWERFLSRKLDTRHMLLRQLKLIEK